MCPTTGTRTGAKANAHEWFVPCVSRRGPLPAYRPSLQQLLASRRGSFVRGPARGSPAANVPRAPSSPWQPRRSPTPRSPTDRPREEPHPFAWEAVTAPGCGDAGGGGTLSCGTHVSSRRQLVLPGPLPPPPRGCGWDPCGGRAPRSIHPVPSGGRGCWRRPPWVLGDRPAADGCFPLAKPSSFLFPM